MYQSLPDTWHTRELPVLRCILATIDSLEARQRAELTPANIAERLRATETDVPQLDAEDVSRAVKALTRGGYVVRADDERLGGSVVRVVDVTEKAYRATGAWPSDELMADRFLQALQDLAEYSPDPVEKGRAQKAAAALGGFSRDTLVSVIGVAAGVAMQ